MAEDYFHIMKTLAFEAGKIALENMDHSEPSFKADQSVLTKADKAVSRLAHEFLAGVLKNSGHVLIEEEDVKNGESLEKTFSDKTPFIWAVDPIDGTRPYSNRIPIFGISIGLLKDSNPWMGISYFPALKEMFYCDGEKAFFVQNAFDDHEKKTPITPISQEISGQSIFFCNDGFSQDFKWDYKDCRLMMLGCAAAHLCWPSVGRSCGSFFRSYLWDFAAPWPIIKAAGLEFRHFKAGTALERIDRNLFDKDQAPWKLKDFYILSSEENFPVLQKKIRPVR